MRIRTAIEKLHRVRSGLLCIISKCLRRQTSRRATIKRNKNRTPNITLIDLSPTVSTEEISLLDSSYILTFDRISSDDKGNFVVASNLFIIKPIHYHKSAQSRLMYDLNCLN